MKKVLSILLTLVMVLAIIPMSTGIAEASNLSAIEISSSKIITNSSFYTIKGATLKADYNDAFNYGTYYLDTEKNNYISYSATDGIKIVLNNFSTKKDGEDTSPNYGIKIDYSLSSTNVSIEFNGDNYIDVLARGIDSLSNLYITVNGTLTIGKRIVPTYGINTSKSVELSNGVIDISAESNTIAATKDIFVTGNTKVSGTVTAKLLDSNQNIAACAEFASGIERWPSDACCIEADRVESTGEIKFYRVVSPRYNLVSQTKFIPISSPLGGANATDIICATEAGTKVTLYGADYVGYPEVWEPYYETLALKIAAQAEIEASKMLEGAKVETSVVEVEKPFELVAKTERMIAPDGKDSVKVTWVEKYGRDLDFEGYDIYRATTVDGTFRFMFNTKNEWYYNTLIRKGNHYWYKVRGYKTVNGERVYTTFSDVVDRTVEL